MSGETFYRSSINLGTKPTSSEVAYSNQSTRTLTTTPLQPYIVAIAQVANVTLQSTFSFNNTKERVNQQKSFSHFGRGCRLISADA